MADQMTLADFRLQINPVTQSVQVHGSCGWEWERGTPPPTVALVVDVCQEHLRDHHGGLSG